MTYQARRRRLRMGACFVLAWVALALFASAIAHAQPLGAAGPLHPSIPRAAQTYRLALKREAQLAWGINAPVATFAAQIHQESRWRIDAASPVGAQGLAQFMPATAKWLGGLSPNLQERAPLNPTWSLRALVTYDRWLSDRVHIAATPCEHMAFTLSAYNGGLGHVYKRQALAAQRGIAADVCIGAACNINPGVSPASQAENAHYPPIILRTFEPLYTATGQWGAGVCT